MLTKKVANIGFETVATVDRRPFGIDALASYPVFPPEFVNFLRRVVPAERHDELVWSVVVLARKPEARKADMFETEGVNIGARKPEGG